MAELSHEDVQQILELIDKSHFDFFELQLGELKLTVSKTPLGRETPAPAASPPAIPAVASPAPATDASSAAAPAPVAPPAAAAPQAAATARAATASHQAGADADRPDGLVVVNAPMVGTFYAQPEPGAPPYVQVGAQVEPETTMGLIEVMKVFTPVAAGTRGVLAEVLVQNAQFVEFGQPLFLIKPDGSA